MSLGDSIRSSVIKLSRKFAYRQGATPIDGVTGADVSSVDQLRAATSALKGNTIYKPLTGNVVSSSDPDAPGNVLTSDGHRVLDFTTENSGDDFTTENSGDSSMSFYSAPVSAPVYQDAPLAQAYGMTSATAYQEALANTSHQREVKDLQAAGLNPVLSANGGSGAAVFGGDVYSTSASGSGAAGSKQLLGITSNAAKNLISGAVGLMARSPSAGKSAGELAAGIIDIFGQ